MDLRRRRRFVTRSGYLRDQRKRVAIDARCGNQSGLDTTRLINKNSQPGLEKIEEPQHNACRIASDSATKKHHHCDDFFEEKLEPSGTKFGGDYDGGTLTGIHDRDRGRRDYLCSAKFWRRTN